MPWLQTKACKNLEEVLLNLEFCESITLGGIGSDRRPMDLPLPANADAPYVGVFVNLIGNLSVCVAMYDGPHRRTFAEMYRKNIAQQIKGDNDLIEPDMPFELERTLRESLEQDVYAAGDAVMRDILGTSWRMNFDSKIYPLQNLMPAYSSGGSLRPPIALLMPRDEEVVPVEEDESQSYRYRSITQRDVTIKLWSAWHSINRNKG